MRGRYERTARLTGTAILAALVIVFDYTLKFSGLKIPFPWLPFLKFDFTGVPIALSLLLYGLPSGGFTSVVACLGIIARSGDIISSLMKGLAEFSTVLGMAAGLYLPYRWRRLFSLVAGIALRVVAMSVFNLIVLPNYYGMPYSVVVGLLPMVSVFNAMQGGITVLLGYFLYSRAIARTTTTHRVSASTERLSTPEHATDCSTAYGSPEHYSRRSQASAPRAPRINLRARYYNPVHGQA